MAECLENEQQQQKDKKKKKNIASKKRKKVSSPVHIHMWLCFLINILKSF